MANRELKKIFGPKKVDVTGEWRKLHKEELHNLYSPYIIQVIKKDEMGRVCGTYREKINVYRNLVGKSAGKRPLRRRRCRWRIILKWTLKI